MNIVANRGINDMADLTGVLSDDLGNFKFGIPFLGPDAVASISATDTQGNNNFSSDVGQYHLFTYASSDEFQAAIHLRSDTGSLYFADQNFSWGHGYDNSSPYGEDFSYHQASTGYSVLSFSEATPTPVQVPVGFSVISQALQPNTFVFAVDFHNSTYNQSGHNNLDGTGWSRSQSHNVDNLSFIAFGPNGVTSGHETVTDNFISTDVHGLFGSSHSYESSHVDDVRIDVAGLLPSPIEVALIEHGHVGGIGKG